MTLQVTADRLTQKDRSCIYLLYNDAAQTRIITCIFKVL